MAGEIESGLLVLLGVEPSDTTDTVSRMAAKICGLRIFEDDEGKMNLALTDVGGSMLCISQFTLLADVRRGRRPSFDAAARPEQAMPLYEAFCDEVARAGIRCERGVFGAHMTVLLVNDGPVTIVIDSASLDAPRRT